MFEAAQGKETRYKTSDPVSIRLSLLDSLERRNSGAIFTRLVASVEGDIVDRKCSASLDYWLAYEGQDCVDLH